MLEGPRRLSRGVEVVADGGDSEGEDQGHGGGHGSGIGDREAGEHDEERGAEHVEQVDHEESAEGTRAETDIPSSIHQREGADGAAVAFAP